MTVPAKPETGTTASGREGARFQETKYTIRLLLRNPISAAGTVGVVFLFCVMVFAPYIATNDPLEIHLSDKFLPPSSAHLFGTDHLGRDIFSRVVMGSRISLTIGFITLIESAVVGTVIGLFAGYKGGAIDSVMMRITDIFLAFPSIILALAVAAALGRGLTSVMVALGVTWWPLYARLIRGQTLSIRREQYIEAARLSGAGVLRIMYRHILPNCIAPLMVQVSMDVGFTILAAAGMGFLGIGAQPPSPDWGLMCATGSRYLLQQWWLSTFPGLAIFLSVISFNLLGDGLRDILDPRLRRG
ncbi:MAG: ABC transporter permease [Candidatus Bathyarchaeota archaeon]|jgi:peptide/nickel transport system permease protein|nr:ABC transporter permease [Candidatus Bathyarchaeota archaeon]